MRTKGFIDGFWLKIIMAALMLLDHMYYGLFPRELTLWHYVARVVAPIFTFLMTEGMVYTRNRRSYILRMFAFAGAMLCGNVVLWIVYDEWVHNSILMELALSASIIVCIDNARNSGDKGKWIAVGIGAFLLSLFFEGGYLVPIMALIFYYLRHNRLRMCWVYAVGMTLLFLPNMLALHKVTPQLYMVFAVVPILLYNGKRGIANRFSKYFFYVFYPVHIWVIFIAERLVK